MPCLSKQIPDGDLRLALTALPESPLKPAMPLPATVDIIPLLLTFLILLLLINGFYLTSCSQGAGIVAFLIVLIPPLLLNVSIGVLIACLFSRTLTKISVFIIGYVAYYAFIIFCWVKDPTFRLLTHASVLITSDLLKGDTVTPAVIMFRTATFLLSLTIILFGKNNFNI